MPHPKNAGYQKGNHWMVCDLCGFDYRKSDMKKTWDGLWSCPFDWEPKQPQLEIKAIKDLQAVRDPRPDTVDIFSEVVLSSLGQMPAGTRTGLVGPSSDGNPDISKHDTIGITLDDGTVHWSFSRADQTIILINVHYLIGIEEAVPSPAAIGNIVFTRGSSILGTDQEASDL